MTFLATQRPTSTKESGYANPFSIGYVVDQAIVRIHLAGTPIGADMDIALGATRIVIGLLILMTGILKFTVPRLRAAWSGQVRLARLPFYRLTFWLFPVAELTVGAFLILGVWTRPAAAVVLLMMLGATYVHVVVHDPSVFPLQPQTPIIPIIVIFLALFVILGGTGASVELAHLGGE